MKKLFLLMFVLVVCFAFTGCIKPYNTPEYVEIQSHQTAFLIPLEGKTSEQGKFMSEEYLEQAQVATKRIQIQKRWNQTGRRSWNGEWIPVEKVILVDRSPVTREWTESSTQGTSSKNEGIMAESKESISFMVRMNVSAQIDENNAPKFLYRYNNKPLSQVMDTEIRAKIESKFVEESAKRLLKDIQENKEEIMQSIRTEVIPYFQDRGITITVIGLKGDFTYSNPEIQKSIDNKFKSAQDIITQENENERIVSKAQAEVDSAKKQAEAIAITRELRQLDIEQRKADAMYEMGKNWRPEILGGNLTQFLEVK